MGITECILTEKRKQEARNRRFKKAICKDINMESIRKFLWDMQEVVSDVAYASQNDDVLVDAMDGDEEEAFEFRAAFGALEADIERFQDDLYEQWVPDCFDDFFAGIGGDCGEMIGYDSFEGDYYGIEPGYETRLACEEAEKRLSRLTKKELVEAAGQCFRIAISYIGLRARYEDLQASLDIIRAKNDGILSAVKQIDDLYVKAENKGFGKWDNDIEKKFDRIVQLLPQECWLR